MAAETKKTMDVSKPGNSAPDTSARPVIVTHKPTVQDPMVKTEQPAEEEPKAAEETTQVHNKVIQPLTEQPSKDAKDEEKPKAEKSSAEKEADKEAAVVDAVAEQADLGPKNKNAGPSEEEKKKQEALAKMITDKKYFVPIGQVAHRRNQRTLVVALILLIALAGAYLAIDAELLNLNIDLPFELIKT